MPSNIKLTKKVIETASYQACPTPSGAPGAYYLWDAIQRGFGVRIFPSGLRSFVVSYWTRRGRKRIMTLGRCDRITLDQARKLARGAFAEVASGNDPAADRRAARERPSPRHTVSDLHVRYMRVHAKPHKRAKSIEEDERLWRLHVLPSLATRAVADVTRAHLEDLHVRIGGAGKPFAANRVLSLLSKAFNLAEQWGWRPPSTNPTRGIQRYKEPSRARALSDDELRSLGAALDEAERAGSLTSSSIAAVRLIILTGCRPGEILGLRWPWVDLDARTIRLPKAKGDRNGEPGRTVWLGPAAVSILRSLPREPRTVYVLPGAKRGKPLAGLQKVWSHLCDRAAIQARLYDLRHTFVTSGNPAGVALEDMSDLAGHADIGITDRIYRHAPNAQMLRAADLVDTRLAALIAPPAAAEPA